MRQYCSFQNLTIATFSLLLLQCFVIVPAYAQMDWLKSGKELLGTVSQSPNGQTASSLTNSDIASGLKDALRVGTEKVVGQLGKADGFNADPTIHIPLPDNMLRVKQALDAIGLSAMMDDLELKLNRAAEAATPPAKKIFLNSIDSMTLDDVTVIYNGPDDAATRYFQDKMSAPLAEAMQPIVEQAINEVGAVQAYDAVMGEYSSLPFVPNVKADLNSYVVTEGMNGIFHYIAAEEASIRHNPVDRTTDILKKVFGAK
jgi:hypothetical protein